MTWMTRTAVLRRASTLLSAGALVALAAGCGNGLQTSAAGSAVPAPAGSATSATATPTGTPSGDAGSAQGSSDDSPSTSSSPTAGSGDTSPTGSSSDSATPTTPTCAFGDLDIGVKTADGGGAAGSVYVLLTFTNSGDSSCDLYGYPGVAFVGDHDGTQLGTAATRASSGRSTVVKLGPGDATTALLQIANAGNFDAKACAPTTSDGFRVYPPASSKAAYVPYKTEACQRTGVRQLEVSPVGTSG